LWNHAPRMWRAQEGRSAPAVRATLDSADMADLFAYFYSLSFSKAPGNATRGAYVFEEKGCANCHERTIEANAGGARNRPDSQSPISTWSELDDPLAWAERMWNHSAKVYADLSVAGLPWPQFSAEEMMDLLTYLRGLPETRSRAAAFQPGDP